MLLVNPDNGMVIDANSNACNFYGYTKEEFISLNIEDLNVKRDENFLSRLKESALLKDEKPENRVISLKQKLNNNKVRDVEVYCSEINFLGRTLLNTHIFDVSYRNQIEKELKESEFRYRSLVESSPNAIIVCEEANIVFANNKALELFKVSDYDSIINHSVFEFISYKNNEKIIDLFKKFYEEKSNVLKQEVKIINKERKIVHFEVYLSYILFNDVDAIQVLIKDISEDKREIEKAMKIQKNSMITKFPLKSKGELNHVWMPAKGVSGDFFEIHKVDENNVIAIVGDVSGKGITAALNVSAVRVLFHEAIDMTYDPAEIINYLNVKVLDNFDEDYVAAICFSINFKEKKITAVGAGINEFLYLDKYNIAKKVFVKGPFLGMFKYSYFGKSEISFDNEEKIVFYTDGMDSFFDNQLESSVLDNLLNMSSQEYCHYLAEKIDNQSHQGDDITCLIIDLF